MKQLLFIALCILCLQCKDETETDGILMTYGMTQCADPWQQEDAYFKDREGTLKNYLIKQGIDVFEVKITIAPDCQDKGFCAACHCGSCDVAEVHVAEKDVSAMEKLKFVKK